MCFWIVVFSNFPIWVGSGGIKIAKADGLNIMSTLFDPYVFSATWTINDNNTYLANITRQSGDAYYYGGQPMLREYPFIFRKIGKNIQNY